MTRARGEGGHARARLVLPGVTLLLLGALTAAPRAAAQPPVPVHIAGIQMISPDQVLLLLADEKEEKAVPISVGRDQGIAIYLGKEKAEAPRPMTHDLLANILKTLGAVVERVTITDLKRDTYFAEIALRSGDEAHAIDARPSDAIALAVRLNAPIFSAPGLLRPLGTLGRPAPTTNADRRLGLSVQELDRDLAEFMGATRVAGVLVASIVAGGPAEKTGLYRGDIIREIDGKPTADLEAYRAAIDGALPLRFSVWREGRSLTLVRP
ncbi:MAG: bifunctional nuclease family protein [Acidobacteria bacterium]|nr:bifunctional nuclease family protein [Acidobacteriota bacterium]